MYAVILFLHVLGATIWVGGHLVLAVCWLPRIVRERAPEQLLAFEQRFERLGMSALALQVVTGLWMAHQLVPDVGQWLHPQSPLAHAIALKLGLLLATVAVAVHARLRVEGELEAATRAGSSRAHLRDGLLELRIGPLVVTPTACITPAAAAMAIDGHGPGHLPAAIDALGTAHVFPRQSSARHIGETRWSLRRSLDERARVRSLI